MKWMGIAIVATSVTLSTASGGTPPVPSGPGFLPGDAVVEVAPFVQETPVVAAGGSGFLVVWTDLRTDESFFGYEQGARDIYAARLDAAGNLIDTSPIVVNQAFGAQEQPQVSWNEENWLVVWENQTMGASYYESRIFAARVAPDGTVLDDPPIQVVAEGSSGLSLAVTSRGTEWLVVGRGQDAGDPGIVGVRVSAQGVVLDPTPVVLAPDTYFLYFNISVHSAQGEYLLTYKASSEFKAQRFQSDLSPIGAAFNIPGLTVGSNGTNHFIVWTSGSTLVGSTMSPDGTLQNPGGVAIMPADSWEVDVTWDGVNWWVSKLDGWVGLVLTRVTTGDVVLDPGGFAYNPAIVDFVREHRIAGGLAGGVQLVWKDDRVGGVGPYDIHGAFVSASAKPGPDAPLSLSSHAQTRPDLAAGSDGFLAVFRSERSGTRRILAQRLDALGNAIDAEPVEVTSGPNASDPAVAWNGSVFLIVWYDVASQEILGRRLLPDGNFLDAVPLDIMPGITPDVAALGDVFLVVGTDAPSNPHFRFPFFQRVDGLTGALLDPVPWAIGWHFAQFPKVTAFLDRWVMTWQRNPTHDNPQANLYAALIEPDGTSTGEFVVTYNAFTPDVAASGAAAMFVFRKNSTSNANNDVAARRMLPDGSFPDPEFILSDSPDRQRAPTVAWDGAQFVAAWEDLVNSEAFFDERTDIYAARISESGQNLDPQGFPVATASVPEMRPVLASADGDTLLAGSLFRDQAPHNAYRIEVYHMPGTFTDPPDVSFTAEPRIGCTPMTVDFTDESVGEVTSWSWSFGDGGSATEQNPTHVYGSEGEYTVYLTAGGSLGSNTAIEFDHITASGPTMADFAASVTAGCAPLTVNFSDNSAGLPVSWLWMFGDDSFSTEQAPMHTYEWPGTYTVTLTSAGGCGPDTETKIGYVQIDSMCPITALALSDIPVQGWVSGDYTRTFSIDGYYEVFTEVVQGQRSQLDHRWDFDVAPGPAITFRADAFRYTSTDGDDFEFQYSTDNVNFTTIATATEYGSFSATVPLPATLNGTVYVRLRDTDRTQGNTTQDQIMVNYLAIESAVEPPAHPCEAIAGLTFIDRGELQWNTAASATGYDVVWGDLEALRLDGSVGAAVCGWDDHSGTSLVDGTDPLPGSGFYYLIRGDATGLPAGSYDNVPGLASPEEQRDAEIGTAGGVDCTDAP